MKPQQTREFRTGAMGGNGAVWDTILDKTRDSPPESGPWSHFVVGRIR